MNNILLLVEFQKYYSTQPKNFLGVECKRVIEEICVFDFSGLDAI